jgi:curved DNA-binding protein CbpA
VSVGRDPYEVLGVPRSASVRQIRAAYVERARRAHPDLVGARGLDLMRALNDAWEVLKDAQRRAEFDGANRAAGPASQGSNGTPQDDPSRPFWTGAAGPAPGRPSGPVLDFGIYAGWSLGEIARRDGGYLMWLRDRPEARPFRVDILKLIDPDGAEPVDKRRAWR